MDLQIEFFDGDSPTGRVAMIQVKGKRDSFGGGDVSLGGFPVKTVEYALLFSVPFFVFHTSISDNQTYFIWLQKYAETRLQLDSPRWRDQESVTLHFPTVNVLSSNAKKLEEILIKQELLKECFTYLGRYEWLRRDADQVIDGNVDAVQPAIEHLNRIRSLSDAFSDRYLVTSPDLDLPMLANALEAVAYGTHDEDNRVIDEQLEQMDVIKSLIAQINGLASA